MQAMCTSICTGTIPSNYDATQFSACIFNYNFFSFHYSNSYHRKRYRQPILWGNISKDRYNAGISTRSWGEKIVLSNQQRLRISCLQTSLLSEKRGGEPVVLYRCFQTFPTQHPRQTCQISRFDIQTPM